MKYGLCVKCLVEWFPVKYWNGKYKIWYKGCSKCKAMTYWSGGDNESK